MVNLPCLSHCSEADMSKLLRSEEMTLVQIFLSQEASYNCIRELGELGAVQFADLNEGVNAFSRNYVSEIRRSEEMERRLRFFAGEIEREKLPVPADYKVPQAPNPKDLIDLEATLEQLEGETRQINANQEALLRNFYELKELKHVLNSASTFFQEGAAIQQEGLKERLTPKYDEEAGGNISRHLSFLCGVINRSKIPVFERVLWRASRGKALLRHMEIEEPLKDPATEEEISKSTFIVYFQGEQLKMRVKKICEGLGATTYPCKEDWEERRQTEAEVDKRLEELTSILNETKNHRFRMLNTVVSSINSWIIQVRKVKAIWYTMNKFKKTETGLLHAEGWCPKLQLNEVDRALKRGAQSAGSEVAPILNTVTTRRTPPTYHRTNKLTKGYQAIIDAYGVASYQEINPAIFTIITFPFLFGIMFGDIGHGFIMFLAGLYLVLKEGYFTKRLKSYEEIFLMMFHGRYIIMMNGLFAVYAGFLYNDIFSLSINIFGSSWQPTNYTRYEKNSSHYINPDAIYGLDPIGDEYNGDPYLFGIDPFWNLAENKLTFVNSYKMKLAVILGLTQMTFGLILSFFNYKFKGKTLNIYCTFLPQMIFLQCLIGYLVFMIFFKWFACDATTDQPSLLICLINMFLKFAGEIDEGMQLYPMQRYIQAALVVVAVICVPWMFVAKPIIEHMYPRVRQANYQQFDNEGDDEEEEGEEDHGMMDVMVHQGIETIEFTLGCISNTASYLRLWALSLAHAELSEVLWSMVMQAGLGMDINKYVNPILIIVTFSFWAVLTVAILIVMEGLSAFLHALRLHWVEFQNKFYEGEGHLFAPFSFERMLNGADDE
ncbi:V-type proton ATPase 116 kDa subunit a 1-like isoform X2 [Bolinopsis microptera]|uniref:V-type proton ATPase 116 kDa subunit a 1-like isoform X2 n=1 Tax=Bolinopsis microptera TaxID=2820187 RepID=UPI0030790BCA